MNKFNCIAGYHKEKAELIGSHLDYRSLVTRSEIRKCEYTKFALFFPKIISSILDPLHFHMNFRSSLSISVKR